jgi:hypothetical protein
VHLGLRNHHKSVIDALQLAHPEIRRRSVRPGSLTG